MQDLPNDYGIESLRSPQELEDWTIEISALSQLQTPVWINCHRIPFFGLLLLARDFPSQLSQFYNQRHPKALCRANFERIYYARKLKATLEVIEQNFCVYKYHKMILFVDIRKGRALWVFDKLVQDRNSDKWAIEVLDH